jgi:hypothetical protein
MTLRTFALVTLAALALVSCATVQATPGSGPEAKDMRLVGRFGPHSSHESFHAPYYRKLIFLAYFNGGDRGLIYLADRADTGLHIVELTGAARQIVE